jgi:hypothetical protein
MEKIITLSLLSITVLLLLLLVFCWIYLAKFNRPVNDKLRKAFSTKYDIVAMPFTLIVVGLSLVFAFFSFSTWRYLQQINVSDGIFFPMGLVFTFAAIDIALAFTINRLFQKFA